MATNKQLIFEVLAIAKAEGFDAAAKKVDQLGKSGKKSNEDLKLLSTAATALAPAIVPIGAAAVAAGASVAALGVTGLLAFAGIKKEMAAGTPIGQAYSQTLGTLKTDLGTLERTAASGVLTGFQSSVKDIHTLMPLVNNDTAALSTKLGDIVSHVAPGFVRLFTDANPLLLDFADDLDKGAAKFDQWTKSSDGATKFVDYARAELPKVEDTFLSLATTAGHLAQGIAPLGGTSLAAITAFSKVVNALPIGVLQALAPALAALKVASTVSAGINNLSIAFDKASTKMTGMATGAAGLGGSISVLGGILAGGYLATQVFGSQLDVLANKFATGKILANQNSSELDDLKTTYQEVTGATATTNSTLLDFAVSSKNVGQAASSFSGDVRDTVKHLGDLGITSDQVKNAVGGSDATFAAFVQRLKDTGQVSSGDIGTLNSLHDTFGNLIVATTSATGAAGQLAAGQQAAAVKIDGTTTKITAQTTAANLLKDAFDRLNGGAIGLEQTQNQFLDTLGNLTKKSSTYNGTLAQTNTTGRANREVILQAIQAANQHAQAVADETAKTKGLAAGVRAGSTDLKNHETAIRNAAAAAGLDKSQVDALIRSLGKVPSKVSTNVELTNAQRTATELDTINSKLAALKDKHITVTSDLVTNIYQNVYKRDAMGGTAGGPKGATGGLFTGLGFQRFGAGGRVFGPGSGTSDSVPAWLSAGEFVMNAASTSQFLPTLQAMNAGRSAGGVNVTIGNITIGAGHSGNGRQLAQQLLQGIREDLRRRGKGATANML